MIYNTTNRIAEAFDAHKLHYSIDEIDGEDKEVSILHANIPISGGPTVWLSFLSTDENSDIAVRLPGLFNDVPYHKQARMREICNDITGKCRFIKMYLDGDDVNVEYDLPPFIPEESIGEVAVFAYVSFVKLLDDNYTSLATAMYSEEKDGNACGRAKPSLSELFKGIISLNREGVVINDEDRLVSKDSYDNEELENWPKSLREDIEREMSLNADFEEFTG